MKKINLYQYYCWEKIKIISLFFFAVLLVSCNDDILDENPKSVSEVNFYNTAEEIETAVNAIYAPISRVRPDQVVVLDAHTDWGYGRGSRANYNDFQGFNSGNVNVAASRWEYFYLGIRNANIVIKNASLGVSISQENVDKYVAEAKFLRALTYFELVRNWGSIPLRTEENMEDRDLAKSSVDEIYNFIIADLIFAESNLPEIQTLIGKPTTYAVKTLLADVYLTTGRYSEARDKANEVIQSNKYSLVPVTSKEDFQKNVFGPDIVTSSEEIFYFKCARESGYGNYILFILNHPSTGYFNYSGAYAHYSRTDNPFYMAWDDNDIRKSLWDQINFGLGSTTLVCNKYSDTQAIERSRGAGNDNPIYRYSDALLIYAEASCMVANGPTQEGMEALNQVHRRAYGRDPETTSSIDFNIADYDAESFQDLVLRERAYEFIFEGKRWYDLKRTGKAAEVILAVKGITIAEKAYLWPIPAAELDYNEALDPATDQNPGY